MNIESDRSLSKELAQRKSDHIELALKAQTSIYEIDSRFDYEPLFFSHPKREDKWQTSFLKCNLDYPLWISSMTGGTEHAATINQNLAKLCGKYKLGMGLGSCRSLLTSQDRKAEFSMRPFLGEQPFYANLGIAQVEELVLKNQTGRIHQLVDSLDADGLIIHLNPLQEWIQPGGDRYLQSPLITLSDFLDKTLYPVLIKEVGQGFGPKSLKALLELPLAGIEFGAFGGTNFTLLESLRGESNPIRKPFIHLGHTANEMVDILNALPTRNKEFIISGGVKDVLEGYYLKSKLKVPSVIGMASAFLQPALESFESVEKYFLDFRESLLTAKGVLTLRENK